MPARRRRSAGQGGRFSGRRRPAWAEFSGTIGLLQNAFSNVNLLGDLDVAGSSILGVTVARTIVRIQVENWALAGDFLRVGLLAGRLTDVGVAAPATDLAANPGLSWAWHTELFPSSNGAAINVAQVYDFSSMARRRIRNVNETFLLCLDNPSAATKNLDVFVRVLVALP